MAFKGFRTNVVIRLGAFVILSYVAIWSIASTDWQLTPIVSSMLAIVVLIELVHYVESINRELSAFLEFVTHDDFSASFPIGEKGPVFRDLELAYKRLFDKYLRLNEAKELNHRYLESIVEHVSVALLCLDDKGRITLMNRQAQLLFKSPQLHYLSSLARVDKDLPNELRSLADGDRSLLRLQIDGESLQLALFVTEFELLNRSYKLISFQNIRDELEQREVDFSEKLITVLTHEIMNSVTPIIALSKVIEESLMEANAASKASLPDLDDLLRSVASIQSRGDGLLGFVQAYRNLTSLPRPNRRPIRLAQLLEQTVTLLTPIAEAAGVVLKTHIENDALGIEADPEQIQQVLINLVNNAIEASAGRPDALIRLAASRDERDRILVRVQDNGPGIAAEHLDQIFVPFFTTRQRGTGVGLSVSRQIMRLNHGHITVKSEPGRGAEFLLRFR